MMEMHMLKTAHITTGPKSIIGEYDGDGDGVLSIEELGMNQETFGKIDANNDGQVDESELESDYKKIFLNHATMRLIRNHDANDDGALTVEELGVSQELFDRIDSNADGVANRMELNTFDPKTYANRLTRAYLSGMAEYLMDKNDADGDGFLSTEEFGESEDVFAGLDSNGDGMVDAKELKAYHPNVYLSHHTSNVIKASDNDGDGVLNAEELGVPQQIFEALDKNSDGQADKSELLRSYPVAYFNNEITRIIANSDADGDGFLTADELGMSEELFARTDTNGDEQASSEELKALFQEFYA